MAGTNWNPDVSPSSRPTGVMTQFDGNLTHNYDAVRNVRTQDGIPYGDGCDEVSVGDVIDTGCDSHPGMPG
jgi:hypothetical protein